MKVIVVDDERNALKAIEKELVTIDEIEEIELFDNPNNALKFIQDNHVDVAFLDIEMFGMTGIFLAKKIKEIRFKTNIIFVTGYSNYALDAFEVAASGYLLKPVTKSQIQNALEQLRYPIKPKEAKRVQIQTFGNFEVFADNKPIVFKRAKSKELLAYLIDRRGASISKRELAAILFEDDYSKSKQSYIQTLTVELMNALKLVDAQDILIKQFNGLAVDTSKIDCDCYRFLAGETRAINEYNGEYMTQYSWALFTLANLDEQKSKK